MGVSVTTEADARAPRAQAFACIAPIDLSKVFPRYGPLPAVVGTSEQTGAWDHAGASRIVNLSDGSSVREELTAYSEGERFSYRLFPVKSPLRFVVRYAAGPGSSATSATA
jgi:hypothetical protein